VTSRALSTFSVFFTFSSTEVALDSSAPDVATVVVDVVGASTVVVGVAGVTLGVKRSLSTL
jgi:hypothetical protein